MASIVIVGALVVLADGGTTVIHHAPGRPSPRRRIAPPAAPADAPAVYDGSGLDDPAGDPKTVTGGGPLGELELVEREADLASREADQLAATVAACLRGVWRATGGR
jgi:hypothetical protein